MILNIILLLVAVSAIASIMNLCNRKKDYFNESIPLEVQMPGNLPIIALSNNGNVLNFLIDSGSNISHICSEYFNDLKANVIGTFKDDTVEGLGAVNTGITMCNAVLEDINGNEYSVNLSISDQLSVVSKSIEESTGIKIHGLLGTDFLRVFKYIVDFESLRVYTKK